MCVLVLLVLPPSSMVPLWDLGTPLGATRALKGKQTLEGGFWGCEAGTASGPLSLPSRWVFRAPGYRQRGEHRLGQGAVGSEVWWGLDMSGVQGADGQSMLGAGREWGTPGTGGAVWADGAVSAGFPAG